MFDLEKIMKDFIELEKAANDKVKRSQIIQQMSSEKPKHRDSEGRRKSLNVFEKQLSRFIEEVEEFTFYSVHGLSIQSDFTLDVSIVVADRLTETLHEK